MKLKSEEIILSATKPSDIFSMDIDKIEQEKEEYLSRFKPQEYNTVRNFVITQKVVLLYRQALSEIKGANYSTEFSIIIEDKNGNKETYEFNYVYNIKLGKMYVTKKNIIFLIDSKYKNYYDNYISKTKKYSKVDNNIWNNIQYMLPNVVNNFQTSNDCFAIIIDKPEKAYPLREILNYFEGKIAPEYVASIITRLCYFVCYLEIIGLNHNGITIDNIFFSPGRTVNEGEKFTIEDIRIVGIYSGWFFSTWSDEKIVGLPKEVFELLPSDTKISGFSSYKVDLISIKNVARKLLGNSADSDILVELLNWINSPLNEKDAYQEFKKWEEVRTKIFPKHRFVEMHVSIN